MLVDLVQVTTVDGVRLDGVCQQASPVTLPPHPTADDTTVPPGPAVELAAGRPPLDAVVMVHGTGGSFYTSTLFERLGERLLAQGISTLRVNSRGHDLISTAQTVGGPKRQGAAYEELHECRYDVAAWCDWLARKGLSRIGLVGHSSGAIKVLFSQAFEPHAAVTAVLAISPPRLSHAWFANSPVANDFLAQFRAAEEAVNAGRGSTLLDVKFPLPYLITANGYVEKYGPDERYNFLNFLKKLRVPVLLTFGGLEVAKNIAFAGLPDAVAELAATTGSTSPTSSAPSSSAASSFAPASFAGPSRRGRIEVATVPDADHFYGGRHTDLAKVVTAWLGSLT